MYYYLHVLLLTCILIYTCIIITCIIIRRSLSVHESRLVEHQRDQAVALLEQEKSRCEFLQQQWDDEKLQRRRMEVDMQDLSSMIEADADLITQMQKSESRGRVVSPKKKSRRRGSRSSSNGSSNSGNSSNSGGRLPTYPQ